MQRPLTKKWKKWNSIQGRNSKGIIFKMTPKEFLEQP